MRRVFASLVLIGISIAAIGVMFQLFANAGKGAREMGEPLRTNNCSKVRSLFLVGGILCITGGAYYVFALHGAANIKNAVPKPTVAPNFYRSYKKNEVGDFRPGDIGGYSDYKEEEK